MSRAKRYLDSVKEAEQSSKANPKLHKKVMDKLKKIKGSRDADFKLDLVKNMDPKKLSPSDLEDLKDFDKEFK